MRADRLVSLVLILRQRGLTSATTLARELEVSTRTVLRDVEALSTAGVPVYAERGSRGGFALLPGFRTELTGLSHDEAVALLAAASRRGQHAFGLSSSLASAVRKVVDAVPEQQRLAVDDAARRLLVDPDADLLTRPLGADEVAPAVMTAVRRSVLAGCRLRLHYAATGHPPAWRTLDPIGLVTVHDRAYLLATRDGIDRTYRLSRALAAEPLDEPARRPDVVDLDALWRERTARFLAGRDHLPAVVLVRSERREQLLERTLAVRTESAAADGWSRLEITFQDLRHAVWALWQLGPDAEAVAPATLRDALHERALAVAGRYTQD